ncbi:MAG: helix-turn-helix transcriptional regulator [Saprospiraceae bacterium]|nr:helix-turn-helix transcriptional regulator [Saprospiraceae bacterium]
MQKFRSTCPIASALDLLGDKWSLLIIRDLAFMGKRTYSEFLASEEKISTNILADRLGWLEENGMVSSQQDASNKKKYNYHLTEKGLDLLPLLLEIIIWSDKHLPEHIAEQAKFFALQIKEDKAGVLAYWRAQLSQ